MPSHPQSQLPWDEKESVSRTMLYKKITKPLLERQRRARINRCLDELKELMSAALAADGENLTKLEKADVLELTVRHLHQLHRDGELSLSGSGLLSAGAISRSSFHNASLSTAPPTPMDRRRYQGGFLACAQQVASYVMKTPGLEPGLGQRLLAHLARSAQQLSSAADAPPQQQPQPGQQSTQLCLPEPPLLRMTPAVAAATNNTLVVDGAQLQTPARLANNRQYAVTAQLQFSYVRPEQQQRLPETSAGAEYRDKMPPNKRYAHFTFPVLPTECSAGAPPPPPPPPQESARSNQLSPRTDQVLTPAAASADKESPESMWRPW